MSSVVEKIIAGIRNTSENTENDRIIEEVSKTFNDGNFAYDYAKYFGENFERDNSGIVDAHEYGKFHGENYDKNMPYAPQEQQPNEMEEAASLVDAFRNGGHYTENGKTIEEMIFGQGQEQGITD